MYTCTLGVIIIIIIITIKIIITVVVVITNGSFHFTLRHLQHVLYGHVHNKLKLKSKDYFVFFFSSLQWFQVILDLSRYCLHAAYIFPFHNFNKMFLNRVDPESSVWWRYTSHLQHSKHSNIHFIVPSRKVHSQLCLLLAILSFRFLLLKWNSSFWS